MYGGILSRCAIVSEPNPLHGEDDETLNELGEIAHTMKRVLITQSGLVQIVLVAPATMADSMWSDHECSRTVG